MCVSLHFERQAGVNMICGDYHGHKILGNWEIIQRRITIPMTLARKTRSEGFHLGIIKGMQPAGACDVIDGKHCLFLSEYNTQDVGTIAHELCHIRQVKDGRMSKEGLGVIFDGKRYENALANPNNLTEYFNYPWEIEAYRAQHQALKVQIPFSIWYEGIKATTKTTFFLGRLLKG